MTIRSSAGPARDRFRLPALVAILVGFVSLVSGCSLLPPRIAAPPTPAAATPLPTVDGTDRERHTGNWNVIHRVDVPDGWTLSQVQVSGTDEGSGWQRPADASGSYCGVRVYEVRAAFSPQPSGGEPVDVGGRPGLWLGKGDSYESLTGLWWNYRPDAWASLECGDRSRDEYRALAELVTFRPTKVLLPFRLTAVPKGYDVGYLGWDQVAGGRSFYLALAQTGGDEFPLPPEVTMAPAATPGRTAEQLTINGRTASYDPGMRTLCFALSGWQACVEGGSDSDPPEPDGGARLRARLLSVAEVMDFAPDLSDPDTWFDGNQAAAAAR